MGGAAPTPDRAPPAPDDQRADEYGLRLTALAPLLFRSYERLCRAVATDDVHNLAFFLSTAFCGPVGIYVWEARDGWVTRRLNLGRVAWLLPVAGIVASAAAGNPGPLILLGVLGALLWTGRLGEFVRRAAVGLTAWAILVAGVAVFVAGGWIAGLVALAVSRPLRWLLKVSRLARRHPDPDIPSRLTFEFSTLDIVSLAFIGLIFLSMVANRDDLVRMDGVTDSDPAYHMAVARQILEHKTIPLWDRWEYAPFGRPHLYPPLVHVLIAFFSGSPEDVTFGFNTIQILLYPLALLSGWYFARWLFGAALGFAALVFLSMDSAFLMTQAMVLPSQVVTALVPGILMFFMARRTFATICLLTAALYTHGPFGVPEFVIVGLLVFTMRYRSYLPVFRKVVAVSLFLYLPWLIHVLTYGDWLGTSSGAMGAKNAVEFVAKGLVQLQIINPVLLLLALRTWWRDKDEKLGVVKCLLIGFLPMLFSYGGRYFMHTWPLWAILAARTFERWIERARAATNGEVHEGPSLARRVVAFVLVAFTPLPVVSTGMPGGRAVNVWPGVTGLNAAVWIAFHRTTPDRDFEELAGFVRHAMEPGRYRFGTAPPPHDRTRGESRTYREYLASPAYAALKSRIVHIGTDGAPFGDRMGSIYFGDRIAAATGCRVDTGGWGPEVRSPLMAAEVARAREEDPRCLFAFHKKGGFGDEEIATLVERHRLEWRRRFGTEYLVGGRGIAGSLETF